MFIETQLYIFDVNAYSNDQEQLTKEKWWTMCIKQQTIIKINQLTT